jgi:hypothetical protein
VPLGTIARGTPDPRIASETARTVPSPPATSTTVAARASAVRVMPCPGSSTLVGRISGSAQPARAERFATAAISSGALLTLTGL